MRSKKRLKLYYFGILTASEEKDKLKSSGNKQIYLGYQKSIVFMSQIIERKI